MRNGPLLVRGRVDVKHEDGTVETLPRAALCRCGQSANKPFCDKTHLRTGFRAPGELIHIELSAVRERTDMPLERAAGPRGSLPTPFFPPPGNPLGPFPPGSPAAATALT